MPTGTRAQFEQQAMPHLRSLYRLACQMAGAERAEDLVQETYLRAWTHFHQFQPGTNCRAWLCRILHNIWVSEWRRARLELPVGGLAVTRLAERRPAAPVALARALAVQPRVLLLDEPLSSLDPLRGEVRDTVLEILGGHDAPAVIVVTHDVDEAERSPCSRRSRGDRLAGTTPAGPRALGRQTHPQWFSTERRPACTSGSSNAARVPRRAEN